MRLITCTLILAGSLARWLPAQPIAAPRIGTIDFYGLHKVSEQKIKKSLGFAEGDPLPSSKLEAEERVTEIKEIVSARLQATCCDNGKVVLYVGIEERGAPHFDTRQPPEGDAHLPDDLVAGYRQFLVAVAGATKAGNIKEDFTHGHSLMADPEVRAYQMRFTDFAGLYLKEIREVLRNSADDEQRAMAAYVLGYARKKAEIVPDLEYALKDADETVRGNALRSLGAISVLAQLEPDLEIKISPTWFVEMLNSIVWTDRNNAAVTLVNLTEGSGVGSTALLNQLRDRAMPALVEMARWKQPEHALPAYILLARVGGLSEEEMKKSWLAGEREDVIQQVLKKKKKGE